MTERDELDARVRRHYDGESLGEETLGRLEGIVQSTSVPETPLPRRAKWVDYLVAAVVLLSVGMGLLFVRDSPGVVRGVAAEIALNHDKQLPAEFAVESFADLGPAMPKLDFVPAEPRALREEGLSFEGGRYCSIGGLIAAQIRLRDARGRACTLYQFRVNEAFTILEPTEVEVDGVRVRLWREGKLIMGLARPLH